MIRIASLAVLALSISLALPASATPIEITGRFLYQDRLYDENGYTGLTQDLPIRHADVEVVSSFGGNTLATGSTEDDGSFALTVDLVAPTDLYVRCLSATENHPDYHILVVDRFVRVNGGLNLSQSVIHSIAADAQQVDPLVPATGDFGEFLSIDVSGSDVAQVFNILDNAIDAWDYLATPEVLGAYPPPEQFVVYGWNFISGSTGSNYASQGIFITARPNDTDGWADTVILHETGHWATDMFSADDNPGGFHAIGDNLQDPRLSYGEGYPTFFCGQVREFRAPRLGELGQPVDGEVTLYADLGIPPTLPNPGGLEFSYDFETALYGTGTPIVQYGTTNETNVTSVLWDLYDGPTTPDTTPGADDDPLDDDGTLVWDVLRNYMPARAAVDWITIEDFHDGWFVRHGQDFQRGELDQIFVDVGQMPLAKDEHEPDDDPGEANPIVPLLHLTSPSGTVVINEIGVDPERVELYNAGETPVDMTGWRIETRRNGLPSSSFVFPEFTLYSGAFVTVHAGGDTDDNGPTRLYDPNFLVFWVPEDDGACSIWTDANVAVDFLRWDNLSGSDPSTAPIPSGLTWIGSLLAAETGKSLGRDKDGTDTDDASDFTERSGSFGAPNFDQLRFHTIYPEGDRDLLSVSLEAGQLLTVQAVAPHSAGEPVVELLSADGVPAGEAYHTYGLSDLAQLDLLAPNDTTLFVRVSNRAVFTKYTPIDLALFRRPSAQILGAPSAFVITPDGASDLADEVSLQWLNGGAYDGVEVWRDGALLTTLAGDVRSYSELRPRGLYEYAVRGILGGAPTDFAAATVFAGTVSCHVEDGLEAGAGGFLLESPWALTSELASEGTMSLTESPGGNYLNNQDAIAELIEPAYLVAYTTLEFDHICATEPGFDFGFVEISTNYGTSWQTLAQYDGDDYPGWSDGDADPEDWVHESIDLTAYAGQSVRIRFHFTSDAGVVEDGWFLDDIRLSEPLCEGITSVEEPGDGLSGLLADRWMVVGPNPSQGDVRIAMRVPSSSVGEPGALDVLDVTGRRVRALWRGDVSPRTDATWDGRDDASRRVPSGVYFLRLRAGNAEHTARVLRME
ncbi:MAG: lamin tail domain-containing protein [Candidatus Eisenbacteria bacterium]|uniref:Lamin tail domain-containing protein n=1 Tax=Eiseniibacteriota bacterium TaxID=2212470 RepID=A0A956SGS7_UNCEI|nr:lamin tail domain-containing protein [Candidatus Eisenbacteria bacterium]